MEYILNLPLPLPRPLLPYPLPLPPLVMHPLPSLLQPPRVPLHPLPLPRIRLNLSVKKYRRNGVHPNCMCVHQADVNLRMKVGVSVEVQRIRVGVLVK